MCATASVLSIRRYRIKSIVASSRCARAIGSFVMSTKEIPMRVGLDFGTTNSSAAVYDGTRVRLLNLDPINNSPTVMRSTLFITRAGVPSIGREAIQRYQEGNVGREIEYEWRYIG